MSLLTQPRGQIAIGWAVINGQRVPVVPDVEWVRFFSTLAERAGGTGGVSTTELVESAYEDAGLEEVKLGLYAMRDEFNQFPRAAEMAFDDQLTPVAQTIPPVDALPQIQALSDQIAELTKELEALKQGLMVI